MKVTVVDEHHHAMKPYWKQYKKNMTLLHFDSHPDMVPSWNMTKASVQCLCAHKCTDRKKLLEENSIETWIPTLVLEGYVDCVIWVCGPWCTQLPEGTYQLLVGTHEDRVKIARNDGKKTDLPYFGDEDQVAPSKLSCAVPWTLHVAKSVHGLASLLQGKPFALDIDEDYFSVNNPFGERIRQYFGPSVHATIEKIGTWEVHDEYKYYKQLKLILQGNKKVDGDMQNLIQKNGNPYTMAKKLVNKQHISPFKDLLMDAIEHTHLPHITPMGDILTMLGAIETLLKKLPHPRLITVATSREDEYTPELQALDMYNHTIKMLKRVYKKLNVERLDKVHGFSV